MDTIQLPAKVTFKKKEKRKKEKIKYPRRITEWLYGDTNGPLQIPNVPSQGKPKQDYSGMLPRQRNSSGLRQPLILDRKSVV